MGNVSIAYVRGKERVDLILTSNKTVTHHKVQHILEVTKNLMNGSLLIRDGYKIIFRSNKVVVTRNDNFIGRDYVCDCLFMLNVVEGNKLIFLFTILYILILWHGRLGHVNYNTIKK